MRRCQCCNHSKSSSFSRGCFRSQNKHVGPCTPAAHTCSREGLQRRMIGHALAKTYYTVAANILHPGPDHSLLRDPIVIRHSPDSPASSDGSSLSPSAAAFVPGDAGVVSPFSAMRSTSVVLSCDMDCSRNRSLFASKNSSSLPWTLPNTYASRVRAMRG